MSPPHERESKSVINNNVCPPQLKINKDSHSPMKRSSSASSSLSLSSSSPQPSICSSSTSTVMSGSRGGPVAASRLPPSLPPQQRQQPVIIYTHSPKVIQTHPRDFMALVQKLTGLYRPDEEKPPGGAKAPCRPQPKGPDHNPDENKSNATKFIIGAGNNTVDDDIDSSSAITEENDCRKNASDDHRGQVINSSAHFLPSATDYEPPTSTPYINNFPMFNPNPTDLLCSNQANFYSPYGDRMFFAPKNDETQFHQLPLWR